MSRILIIEDHNHVSHAIGDHLTAARLPLEYAAGNTDSLQRLRLRSFGVIITSADSAIEESLALLQEMRSIRPALKCIVLAPHTTPDKVIAALRARVFACFTPPFDSHEIANLAKQRSLRQPIGEDIEILSARPGWVSVRVNCRLITAERLISFAKELTAQLPEDAKHEIMQALREILLNAMEHGAAFNPDQVRRGQRHPHRPHHGLPRPRPRRRIPPGIHQPRRLRQSLRDPTAHIPQRKEEGMRAGGYGLLLAKGTVDELIYNEIGNEAVLIKYFDTMPAKTGP